MIKVSVTGLGAIRAQMDGASKQVAYAASRAINTMAFEAMRAGKDHIRQKIDRPTNFTVNSWYVRRKASKERLEAVVGWSDFLSSKRIAEGMDAGAEFYLAQHWNGGGRRYKAFERQLLARGVLPRGMFAVPGAAAEELGMIDSYGNMRSGVIVQILSSLGVMDEMGYTSNATVRQSKRLSGRRIAQRYVYWAGKPGKNTPLGIWIIDDKHSARGRLRPVIVFVKSPVYRVRLDLEAVKAKTLTNANFDRLFRQELDAAMRTAR